MRRRTRAIATMVVLVVVTLCFLHGPTSAEIRLNTGDLRYCFMGIPISYRQASEPERSQLQRLAQGSLVLRPEWRRCASLPHRTTNNVENACQGFFAQATAWIDEDPRLTRLLAEDVANYVIRTHGEYGAPQSLSLLGFYTDFTGERVVVKPGWRDDKQVQDILQLLGY